MIDVKIEQDIRQWSQTVLEVPNDHLNGLPACPYAKKAWMDNKVCVIETDDVFIEALSHVGLVLDETYDLLICASYALPKPEDMTRWVMKLNKAMASNNAYFMCFHPEYGAEDAELDFLYEHEWESAIKDEYCMIFVQRLTDVDDKSRQLEKLGYYQAFNEGEYDSLVIQRRELRNQYHGNETKSNASGI